MSDLTVSSAVDTLMQASDQEAIRAACGSQTVKNVAASPYIFILSDATKLLVTTAGSSFSIPAFADVAFPIGTYIDLMLDDAAFSTSVEIVAAGGVTFNWSNGNASAAKIYGSQTVRIHNTAQDVWKVSLPRVVGVTGIVKYDGDGNPSAAVEGTDYAKTLAQAQAADSITPAADGTYSVPTSITIVKGIITAIS